eukprot:6189394-Pleurochrysis_carterae.AAC.1
MRKAPRWELLQRRKWQEAHLAHKLSSELCRCGITVCNFSLGACGSKILRCAVQHLRTLFHQLALIQERQEILFASLTNSSYGLGLILYVSTYDGREDFIQSQRCNPQVRLPHCSAFIINWLSRAFFTLSCLHSSTRNRQAFRRTLHRYARSAGWLAGCNNRRAAPAAERHRRRDAARSSLYTTRSAPYRRNKLTAEPKSRVAR